MMALVGWQSTEVPLACDFLAGSSDRAELAFRIFTNWMIASEGDQAVFLCTEKAAKAAGVNGLKGALVATAAVAKRRCPLADSNVDAMFDTMAIARRAFTRPLLDLGSIAVSALDDSLGDPDPFVRAEAAGFLALMGPAASASEPALRRALQTESSPWAAHEMRATLAVLQKPQSR